MADITDVIAAHNAFIARWQAAFTHLARHDGGPASRQARAAAWDELAALIELHLDAEDEICGPAVCRAGPDGPGRVRGMRGGHDDVREILREARLQPAGSPLWQQLTAAALAAWASLPGREEHGILDDLRRAGPALRRLLARQWQAFIAAQIRDQDQTARGPRARHPTA